MSNAAAVLGGEGIAHHVADIVGDEIDLADLQVVQHARNVVSLGLLVVAPGRMCGQAHAAQVRHDDEVVTREIGRERCPHVAGLAIAVQEHDSGAGAAHADVERRSVGRDVALHERSR